ncbi:MAG: GAF domain-containing sensor histidine kinase [Nitrospirae bacterium]|jgi:GAF domain-containing protein|nr:GAF domain-containing sensor histidine kinase [Nitrospirota bacterium]
MNEILIKFLKSNPIIEKYHLTNDEISELAFFLRKYCISEYIKDVVKMVEDVISIDPELNWKDILGEAAKRITEFLHAEAASIRIFDPKTENLVAFGSYNFKEISRLKSIPVNKTVAGTVIKSGRSYLVPDIMNEPAYANKDIVKIYGFNSLMAVPLNIPGFLKNEPDIPGAIQIYYKEKNREFDPLEVSNAELMARRVSYVLAKKRIIDLQKLNQQKEKITEKIFVKLSHREGIKLKDVFMTMIPELVDILLIQSCSLFSIMPDRKHVKIELEYPIGQQSHDITCLFKIEEHPYFDALINFQGARVDNEYERIESSYILIKDPLNSSLSNDELKKYALKNNVNSVLLIPLKANEDINYFLIFYAIDRRQEFTENEIELLTFFGKEIMKALRMEKLDDVLHDFKNPAIAIGGFAKRAIRLLQNSDLNSTKNKINEYLEIISQEALRMQELVVYPGIEGRERIIDLTEVLNSRFRINEEAIREQKRTNIILIKNELQSGLYIYCSPFGLERVMDNLFDNATKAIPENGGELSIKSYRCEDNACFEIKNTGKIDEETMAQIKKGDVKGRGLNIIYRFIQGMHGSIEVFTDDNSTTFRIKIPLYKG